MDGNTKRGYSEMGFSASSSNSRKSTQNRELEDKRYRRWEEDDEDVVDERDASENRHSRSRSPYRRSNRRDNEERRSRSPVRFTSRSDSQTETSYHSRSSKSNNWSDSSSDEEQKAKKDSKSFRSGTSEFNSNRLPSNSLQFNVSSSSKHYSKPNHSLNSPERSSEPKSCKSSSGGISIKLAPGPGSSKSPAVPTVVAPKLPSKSLKVASVFNVDDDDEPEEMPAECKMRMKNVGRETPTSAGPNSYGKTKLGFCNMTLITEKKWDDKIKK